MSTVSSVSAMKEPGFNALIKRQPLLSMYIILFLLGWSGLILQMLDSQGVLSMPSPVAFMVQLLTGWAVLATSIIRRIFGIKRAEVGVSCCVLFYTYLKFHWEQHGQIPFLASRTHQTLDKTCYLNADL
jgi:hypothetical protein